MTAQGGRVACHASQDAAGTAPVAAAHTTRAAHARAAGAALPSNVGAPCISAARAVQRRRCRTAGTPARPGRVLRASSALSRGAARAACHRSAHRPRGAARGPAHGPQIKGTWEKWKGVVSVGTSRQGLPCPRPGLGVPRVRACVRLCARACVCTVLSSAGLAPLALAPLRSAPHTSRNSTEKATSPTPVCGVRACVRARVCLRAFVCVRVHILPRKVRASVRELEGPGAHLPRDGGGSATTRACARAPEGMRRWSTRGSAPVPPRSLDGG
jgi:hypothetical protein